MAREKNAQRATAGTRDVPRLGFECGSYQDGHNVHYASALKGAPTLEPIPARLRVEGDALVLHHGGERFRVFQHNPAAVELLLQELGANCDWFPSLHLARWVRDDVQHWASFALEAIDACWSREEIHLAELRHWS